MAKPLTATEAKKWLKALHRANRETVFDRIKRLLSEKSR